MVSIDLLVEAPAAILHEYASFVPSVRDRTSVADLQIYIGTLLTANSYQESRHPRCITAATFLEVASSLAGWCKV